MKAMWITGTRGLVVALLLSGLVARALSAQDVPRIDKKELKELIGNPDVIILDVRTDGDWKTSDRQIQGALREDPSLFDTWASKYPKDKTLVLYCA
jgi:rhodanese-related sulfurtransferase